MQNHHVNKQQLKNQINKLIYMYLPSSNNPKFTNRMLISKINSPRTINISFKEIEKEKIKNNLQQIKNKNNNKDKQIRLNLPIKNRGIESSQGIYSQSCGKYKGYSQSNDQFVPLNETTGVQQMSPLQKQRSLHKFYLTHKNKEKKIIISPQKIMQKNLRLSISRMPQNSRDRQSFDLISKFYKNPIQKQILLKKSKKQTKDIFQVLNISEYRPQTDHGKSRYNKTVQPRCRCHNKSHIVDHHHFNNTSYQPRRNQLNYQDLIKPKTSALTQYKNLMLNMPQSWTVDSWNTQSKILQQGNSLIQQNIFNY